MSDGAFSANSVFRTIISTKNMELDSKMGGGIPVGCLMLIEGGSGAGKSVLTQQILWGALQDGFRSTLFTSENTVKSLIKQMQSIDLDVLDHLLLGKLRVYPIEFSGLGESATDTILKAIHDQQRQSLIAIDSFTPIVAGAKRDSDIIKFLEACKRTCARDVTIILTLHSDVIGENFVATVRSMCDAHLSMRTQQDGQRIVKTLEVLKIQGAASTTGAVVGFDVEPGWGMRVIPISKARG